MAKICPNCGSRVFCATAHVTQDWIVDENGAFIKSINDCLEVTHFPDDNNLWNCHNCGYSAAGKEFNEDQVGKRLISGLEWKNGTAEIPLHHSRKIVLTNTEDKFKATLIEMGTVELVEREHSNLQNLLLSVLEENGTIR